MRAPGLQSYPKLLKKIKSEIVSASKKIENARAAAYWNIGKHIHKDILKNKDRAGYGDQIFKKLSKDLNISKSDLHAAVAFHQKFSIVHARGQLSWTHYKGLLSIQNKSTRDGLLKKTASKRLSTRQLSKEIKTINAPSQKPLTTQNNIPTLKAAQGPLYTYAAQAGKAGFLYVDLGFRITRQVKSRVKLDDGGFVRSVKVNGEYKIKVVKPEKSNRYTYHAYLERVVDGDTLTLNIDLGYDTFIKETVRLRAINAPELKTTEGDKAKRFVTQFLKQEAQMIVKTHLEDKYGRYLADVWVDDEYLNQRLLDEGLAQGY